MIPRILVSFVFLVAGLLKLRDPLAFADGIAAFHVFPSWAINALAMSVPYFEIFTGIGILLGRTRSAGALAACGLSVVFVVLFASALVRGIDVTCSCFGTWKILQASTRVGFVRALVLLGLSGWGYANALAVAKRNRR
ncbi:MAG: MauE/DoxX family redox-associated membrane protein [Verrucomicrobiota bacterium]